MFKGFFGFGRSPEGGSRPPQEVKKERGELTLRPPTRMEKLFVGALALSAGMKRAEAGPEFAVEAQPGQEVVINGWKWEGAEWPIYDQKTGEIHLKRLIEPGYVPVSRAAERPETVSIVVPYEYARFFDTGEPMDPADYAKAKEFIKQEVQKQLAGNTIGLAWDQADYEARQNALGDNAWVVDSISVHGTASPEAGVKAGGRETIVPGVVEQENVELAELRAIDASERLKEVLSEMGIDAKDVPANISGEELQFSPTEYRTLEQMARAQGYEGSTDAVIYKLVSAYNRNKITDVGTLDQLDAMVAGKRGVQIEVTLKDGKKDTVLLPLPLLMGIFGLSIILVGTRKKKEKTPEEKPETKPAPEPIKEKRPELEVRVPPDVKDAGQVGRDVETGIMKSFDFYEPIIKDHLGHGGEVDVNELTHDILEAWTTNDNALREKIGLEKEAPQAERPRQVFFARMHAIAIKELIGSYLDRIKGAGKDTGLATEWAKLQTRLNGWNKIRDEIERLWNTYGGRPTEEEPGIGSTERGTKSTEL